MHWLIATDLDGTLLDDGYPVAAAAAAIDDVFGLSPVSSGAVTLHVVLATSKTLAEATRLVDSCRSDPMIAFENGAGLAWRTVACTVRSAERNQGYHIDRVGPDYNLLRQELLKLRETPGYDFRGFGDMSPAEVAELTGLDRDSAAHARQRMASEPLIWQGAPAALEAFRLDLEGLGLDLVLGGRFHHVTGRRNKAGAVAAVKRLVGRGPGRAVTTLACGDAPNDIEMMRAAHFALVFPDRGGRYLLPEGPTVTHAPRAGPDAWLECVARIVEANSQGMAAT